MIRVAYQKNKILDEIKKEVDPIVEEGLKWFDENKTSDVEVYKNKQKEIEEKVNPLMQKLYSQGMPAGMPDLSGMAGGMPGGMSAADENDDDTETPVKNNSTDDLD